MLELPQETYWNYYRKIQELPHVQILELRQKKYEHYYQKNARITTETHTGIIAKTNAGIIAGNILELLQKYAGIAT